MQFSLGYTATVTIVLILLLVLIRTTVSSCPSGPVFTHQHLHVADLDVFTTDTSLSCTQSTGISSVPVCYVDSLNELMTQAEYVLQEAVNELSDTILMQRDVCEMSPYDHNGFQSGISMSDTLINGIELMSEIALNMTIINCHQHSRLLNERRFNVHQPIRSVICEMKKLMRFARPIEPSKFRASISFMEMDRSDTTIFTCRNLRRAIAAITHLRNDINIDFENLQ
ncbi:uncharacterized protein LOC132565431 [Ylistrum balloti]|uniref:uncharacterized protein LOC132565431 n=1 Tax=Ylistrum balloti TaxID=509963 RepID=UPI0029059BA3|nr:uncharacterized protein LOC132565431 [Ylistrum balloti]